MINLPKVIVIGIAFSLLLVILFWRNLILHLDQPLKDHDDITYQYFIFENNFSKILDLDLENLFDTRMFYPSKNTLAFGNSLLGESLLGMPLYVLSKNAVLSANFVLLIHSFLAFVVMYLFAYKLTRHREGSLVAGLVYSYNPLVTAHFQQELRAIEFIPLAFLLTEKMLEKVSWKISFALAAVFILQLLSSFYYALFLAIFWPMYLLLRLYHKGLSFAYLIRPQVLVASVIIVAAAYFYLQPYMEVKSTYTIKRTVEKTMLYSARLSDFLFTHPDNKLYGWMNQNKLFSSMRDPFAAAHPTEHSLFPGFTVYVLLLVGIVLFVKKKFDRESRYYIHSLLFILGLALILSFGPYFFVTDTFKIPSLYLFFYQFVPFVDTTRAPSRFMVMGFFVIAVLLAFIIRQLSRQFKHFKALSMVIMVLLVLEYWQPAPMPYAVSPEIRQFYGWLNQQSDVKVILELPIGNRLTNDRGLERASIEDAQYLFYATNHDKYLINGYHAFVPPEMLLLGNSLTINFPTKAKITFLKEKGVDLIIVHHEEYRDLEKGRGISEDLERLGLKKAQSIGFIDAYVIP